MDNTNDNNINYRVVKTENNQAKSKEKNKLKNNLLKLDLIENDFCINNKNKEGCKNENAKNDFKEKYQKLMDDINKNKKTEQKIEKEKNIKNQIIDIEKDVIKSKKELDEINKNLNLLIKYNKDKKQIKYKSKENLIQPNLFLNRNLSYINNIDNNININNFNQKPNKLRKKK